MSRTKSITVVRRKLGKHRAWGRALGDGHIEIDATLKGREYLEILIHEFLHEWEWALPETVVVRLSRSLSKFLYRHRIRAIEAETTELVKRNTPPT